MAKDRVSIASKYNDGLVKELDKSRYLGLGKPTTRDELYMYALAIGVESGNAPKAVKGNIGFANTRSIPHEYMSEITSLLADRLIQGDEYDEIANVERAIELADQYANLGFEIIESDYASAPTEDDESVIWDKLASLDEKYQELFE